MPLNSITPLILAGGKGTRLRPLTGEKRPKPFVKLMSDRSMFQNTAQRFLRYDAPVILTHEDYKDMVFDDMGAISARLNAIVCEPTHQGTAASITAAAITLRGRDTIMMISPVDHAIDDEAVFHRAVEQAAELARDDVCLIGAAPKSAETRYGYIQYDRDVDDVNHLCSFHEKPDARMARAYVESGCFLWHTGMFLCRPDVFLSKMQRFNPALYEGVENAMKAGISNGRIVLPERNLYERIAPMSVDLAFMENLKRASVVELQTDWCDIGSWPSYLQNFKSRPNARQTDIAKIAARV